MRFTSPKIDGRSSVRLLTVVDHCPLEFAETLDWVLEPCILVLFGNASSNPWSRAGK